MTQSEMRSEALIRAKTGLSMANYSAIFEGFTAKGIAADQIEPRENVLTFNAWLAVGRHVKKGEHGVKVLTYVERKGKENEEGERKSYRFPKTTTVFHISQTEPNEKEVAAAGRQSARSHPGRQPAQTGTGQLPRGVSGRSRRSRALHGWNVLDTRHL